METLEGGDGPQTHPVLYLRSALAFLDHRHSIGLEEKEMSM